VEPDGERSGTAGPEQRSAEVGAAPRDVRLTTCCVVGAGPAGAVLALLLAR
jgi:NADPH-dependent 2,4-dienoyl-CoA reductase/sulfur reductase-like enzyme